jgi:anti-anti-sigma regulatory factor
MQASAFEAFPDASVDPAPSRPAVFHWASSGQGLKLLEVEGKLEDAAVTRWSGVLRAGLKDGARGIVVDLRGCPAVGPICLSALLAAASTLRARGGGGVTLVTYPNSTLDRKLRVSGTTELPAHSSATRALVSLRDAK